MKLSKTALYIALFGLIFFRYSVSYLIIISFPSLASEFNLSNFQLGTILSVYFLTSIIFIFFWIYAFGKYSRRLIFFINSLTWITGTILFSFSQDYFTLLFFAGLIGCGIESSTVFIILILFQMSPKTKQGGIFSLFITVQGLGSLFGIFMTAYFENILNYEWNFIFLFIGIILLIWLLITTITLNIFKNIKEEITPYLDELGYNLNFKEMRRVLDKKANRTFIILWLYFVPITSFLNIWTQLYYQDVHSLSQMEASLSFIFLSGGEFLGMVFGGWLYDRYYNTENYNKMFIAIMGLILSIPLFIVGFIIIWNKNLKDPTDDLIKLAFDLFYFAMGNFTVFISYILLFLGFFCFALIYPFFLIIINDCNDENSKSAMIGLRNIIKLSGQVISPILGGYLIDNISIVFVMLLVPIFLTVGVIHLILSKNQFESDFLQVIKGKQNNQNI